MKKLLTIIVLCLCFHYFFESLFEKHPNPTTTPKEIEPPAYTGNF